MDGVAPPVEDRGDEAPTDVTPPTGVAELVIFPLPSTVRFVLFDNPVTR